MDRINLNVTITLKNGKSFDFVTDTSLDIDNDDSDRNDMVGELTHRFTRKEWVAFGPKGSPLIIVRSSDVSSIEVVTHV